MAAAPIGKINFSEYPKGVRTIDCYEKLEQIGEGTYGLVYKARDKETGEIVALKKFRLDTETEGFPITAIREIKILSKLDHENVIKLKETVQSPGPERDRPDGNKYRGGIYMVFEYMEHDLAGLTDRPGVVLTPPQIKCYMKQLLLALHFCHANRILHRDIKASNLLINNEGILKLADFGLAKQIASIDPKLTNRVVTLWYRPPELLLGATNYGPAVDIWSAGCILAELLNDECIFRGRTEVETLNQIFELCGAPDDTNWPGVSNLPLYSKLKPSRPMRRRLGEVYGHFEKHAMDLLERMLTLNPAQRISAFDALDSDYFWTDPLPSDPKSLPKYEPSHFYEIKRRRKHLRQRLFGISPNRRMMPPPKTHDGSQPGSSSLHGYGSGPYPPPPRERPSAGSHGAGGSGSGYRGGASSHPKGGPYIPHGYGSSYGSRDKPSSGSHGGGGGGSGFGGGTPNYPRGYGSSHGSRDMPSSGSHGGGGGGSGSGGGAPSHSQGGSSSSDEIKDQQ